MSNNQNEVIQEMTDKVGETQCLNLNVETLTEILQYTGAVPKSAEVVNSYTTNQGLTVLFRT